MQPAAYIEILNLTNDRVALLSPQSDGVKNARLEHRVNGEVKLKFILPRESEKWGFIDALHKIRVNGHVFLVSSTDEERDQAGRLLSNVQCEEIWVRDLGKLRGNYLAVEILSTAADNALNQLLAGTGWAVGGVTVTGIHDLETEKESCLWNVRKVQEIWGGILVFDSVAKTVSLLADADYGRDNDVQFRYAKNLKSIRRTVDHDVVTRLFPFGQDGLDIAGVNGGLKYLENFQYTTEILEDTWGDQSYDEAGRLKAKATEVLETISRPRATYAVKLADLSSLTGFEIEAFDLGDWVTVIDPDIVPAGVKVRIIRYSYDAFEPWNADVELGDPQETLADFLSNAGRAAQLVNKVVAPSPSVGNLLKGVLNTFYTQINGASGRATMDDGVWTFVEVDGQGNETGKRVRISPAGIGISNDHGQSYDTALTGAGVLANTIICNALYALSSEDGYTKLVGDGLKVFDAGGNLKIHLGKFSATGYGVKVLGGEIYSTRIRSGAPGDTNYIEFGAGWTPLKVVVNNKTALDIWTMAGWGGMVQWYDDNLDDMRGQILPYNDAVGQGLRICGRRSSGVDYPIHISSLGMYLTGDAHHFNGRYFGNNTDVTVWGNFYVTKSKSALHETKNYGLRSLCARESPESRFIDEGVAQLVGGKCAIELDPIFLECIEPDTPQKTPWLVHLTPMGQPAGLYVEQVGPTGFVVKAAEPDVRFFWSLSAVRQGYAGVRLPGLEDEDDKLLNTDWEDELVKGVGT